MNIDNLMISVIIPVYKADEYLKQCVDSILNQSINDLEVILVDDGSPDKCPIICDEYLHKDQRVKVIHKSNGGASSARNAGLNIAQGKYVSFVDADDYLEWNYFSELLKFDAFGADVIVSGSQSVTGLYQIDEVKENFYSWGGFTGPCEKLYRLDKVKNIRFREDIVIGEDIIFNLSVIQQINQVYYVNYSGYHITDNPNSLTRMHRGRFNPQLDEEHQRIWGEIHASALREAGIPQESTTTANINGCSVWIFQKIANYCYPDCPHPYNEKIKRIQRQLINNRDMISQVTVPTSPKTYYVIKLCMALRSAHASYWIIKLLTILFAIH